MLSFSMARSRWGGGLGDGGMGEEEGAVGARLLICRGRGRSGSASFGCGVWLVGGPDSLENACRLAAALLASVLARWLFDCRCYGWVGR